MFKNYLVTVLRIFVRNKTFSLINIFGVALSMSVCMFLVVFIVDQMSYDKFHSNHENIYRVISDRTGRNPSSFATSPAPLVESIRNNIAEVSQVVQIYNKFGGDTGYDQITIPMNGIAATQNFLDVFDFNLLAGDYNNALVQPRTVVLSEQSTKVLFGSKNPIGTTIQIGNYGDFSVTGVIENPPHNSHLRFDFLVSYSSISLLKGEGKLFQFGDDWADTNRNLAYLLLKPDVNPDSLQPWLNRQSELNYHNPTEYMLHFQLQRLTDITLGKFLENDVKFSFPGFVVYFLVFLVFLVMLSAGFNYTNLSMARALSRAREVGIRKVSGAERLQLFTQFVGEAVLLTSVAFIVAIVLLEVVLLPGFSQLWTVNYVGLKVSASGSAYLVCFIFCLLTGAVAGLAPAYYLSAFQPEKVLKGLNSVGISKLGLRKLLIVAQFALSLIFMATVFTIYQQLSYMLNKDFGFNPDNIINVDLQGRDYQLVKSQIESFSGISNISASSILPNAGGNRAELMRRSVDDDFTQTYLIDADQEFISNLELTLLAGRNFPLELSGTAERFIIINEAAVKAFGFNTPEEAIGKTLDPDQQGLLLEVLGVVKDFHYRELLSPIEPFMLRYRPFLFQHLNIKIVAGKEAETLEFIKFEWSKIDSVHPLKFDYYENQIKNSYGILFDLAKIITLVCVLSISIAMLGLLGIAALSAEERIRELGIRKVVGATQWNLLKLPSRNFMFLLSIAVVVGLPLAWVLNSFVLTNFAYRIDSPAMGLVVGITILLGLGGLTVCSQAIRASNTKPTESLRYE